MSIINFKITHNYLKKQQAYLRSSLCFFTLSTLYGKIIHRNSKNIPAKYFPFNKLSYLEDKGIDVHIITMDAAQIVQNPNKFSALPETSTLQKIIAANNKIKSTVETISSMP